jgi:polysaccharide deacetylase 2 family uncharacterized protein YibQ
MKRKTRKYSAPDTLPPDRPTGPEKRAALIAADLATTSAQVDAFQAVNPSVPVVGLPNASHRVAESNQADAPGEMNPFVTTPGSTSARHPRGVPGDRPHA